MFYEAAGNGVRLYLRVTPKAPAAGIAGLKTDGAGRQRLHLKVTEPPEKGKANRAVIKMLAKQWGVPPSAISVAAGETGRDKILSLEGDSAAILKVLHDWTERELAS